MRQALKKILRARDWGCRQLFDTIDADGDGTIDKGELQLALKCAIARARGENARGENARGEKRARERPSARRPLARRPSARALPDALRERRTPHPSLSLSL